MAVQAMTVQAMAMAVQAMEVGQGPPGQGPYDGAVARPGSAADGAGDRPGGLTDLRVRLRDEHGPGLGP